jgi:hypothetical protein
VLLDRGGEARSSSHSGICSASGRALLAQVPEALIVKVDVVLAAMNREEASAVDALMRAPGEHLGDMHEFLVAERSAQPFWCIS